MRACLLAQWAERIEADAPDGSAWWRSGNGAGMAFEAGVGLAIPERVPYRLTRDLVDALGPMGVEGTFR